MSIHRVRENGVHQLLKSDREREKLYFRRCLFWVLFLCFSVLIYFYILRNNTSLDILLPSFVFDKAAQSISSGFLVDTAGCRIPDMEAFDLQIIKFIYKVKPIKCSNTLPLLVDSNLTSLYVVHSALSAYGVKDVKELDCYYKSFSRVESSPGDNPWSYDNVIQYSNTYTPFENGSLVKDEFVNVVCSKNDSKLFKHFHAFVPLKPEVETRCLKAEERDDASFNQRLNVLVLGTDGVSRLNFHRQMPKTIKLLKDIDAIEIFGYNKVADNTFPNLVPVLTGLSEEELIDLCWPTKLTELDSCPWIWKNFSSAGYRTVLGEDATGLSLFAHKKYGFIKQPTDYYLRPFMKTNEDEIGNTHTYVSHLCLGSQLSLTVLLNYVSKFVKAMSSKLSFGFFWATSLTHDNINYPKLGDKIYEDFINQLSETGTLNKTALILISDHGIRYGKIREIYQGRLEERLPFLFFVLPKWFKEHYPEAVSNLQRNSHRLTSPFDIYETLLDFLNLHRIEKETLQRRTDDLVKAHVKPRSISLFLPIHESRTCDDAGIIPHWCTCQRTIALPLEEPIVKNLSLVLVKHLNSLLEHHKNCSELHLAEIKSAQIQIPLQHLYVKASDHGFKDYVLVIRTIPGGGLFEATLRYRVLTKDIQIAGTVSRINAYGNQSECITEYDLMLYCYCLS